jgi:hypothetical protein
MPYRSLAQAAYFHKHREKLEAAGVDVDEWDEASRGKKIPKKIKQDKKQTKSSSAQVQELIDKYACLKEAKERDGLWANIRAKRARGEKPARPGDKDYPDKTQWRKLTGEK